MRVSGPRVFRFWGESGRWETRERMATFKKAEARAQEMASERGERVCACWGGQTFVALPPDAKAQFVADLLASGQKHEWSMK